MLRLLATTGLQCFEGMKAYKSLNGDGSIRLFRPDKNMKRLQDSMDRLHMPGNDFDGTELTECIKELVRTDAQWIPEGEGYSLYIRPTVIATHKYLGVAPPDSILLYVICCPVGPYYKSGFEPVRLTADTSYVRAWPGGTGGSKVGGNYGATSKLYDMYVQQLCTPNSTVPDSLFGYCILLDVSEGAVSGDTKQLWTSTVAIQRRGYRSWCHERIFCVSNGQWQNRTRHSATGPR